jgi:type I restriction enzyme M protein
MIEISLEKVGVIVPHGVLFRGGSEEKIRQKLVEDNLLEAVVGLPPNLFYGTGIPAAILVFNRGKKTRDILFIDASREFEQGTNQNRLRPRDIENAVLAFREFESKEMYAYRATAEEVIEKQFNLSIPRYVETFVKEPEMDMIATLDKIRVLESDLQVTREEIANYLSELGISK